MNPLAAWYVTDMAEGDRSFHWPTCPNCPADQRAARVARPATFADAWPEVSPDA